MDVFMLLDYFDFKNGIYFKKNWIENQNNVYRLRVLLQN